MLSVLTLTVTAFFASRSNAFVSSRASVDSFKDSVVNAFTRLLVLSFYVLRYHYDTLLTTHEAESSLVADGRAADIEQNDRYIEYRDHGRRQHEQHGIIHLVCSGCRKQCARRVVDMSVDQSVMPRMTARGGCKTEHAALFLCAHVFYTRAKSQST